MSSPCLCGAYDCPKCFPDHFNYCSIHGMYSGELSDCPKCEREIENEKEEDRRRDR